MELAIDIFTTGEFSKAVLRDKNLVPLSHQHQHALALCVRINRALGSEADIAAWQEEFEHAFSDEISHHFAAEEQVVFPAIAKIPELAPLVKQLLAEHVTLRNYYRRAQARELNREELWRFATALHDHIRLEERQLFELAQQALSPEELNIVGQKLESFFHDAGVAQACSLSSKAAEEAQEL
jgi:hemerythrin-like domain-containing protein